MHKVIQQTSANAKESASASEEMNAQAEPNEVSGPRFGGNGWG